MPKDATDAHARPVEMRLKRKPPEVLVIASPAYDLLLSLYIAFSQRIGDFELDPQRWPTQAREKCSPDLLAALAFYFGDEEESQWCAGRLCKLLWQTPAPESIPATLDWLAQLPPEDVLTVLLEREGLGDDWYDTALELIRAHTGKSTKNDVQTKSIQAFSRRYPEGERAAVVRFLSKPADEQARLIDVVRQWHALVFADEEAHITAAITQEAAAISKRVAEQPVAELVSAVMKGIEFDLPAAMKRVVLAPSALIAPTVFHFPWGDTATYCYPIPDAPRTASDSIAMQRREMVRLFEALSDDTRLRILRHLAERQMYLTELSEHLRLTKATTRHHMVRLRSAGLVTVHIREHLSYYSLRRETLDEPTRVLLRYLGLNQTQS